MKILQIINSLHSGGAEKLIVETSRRYLEGGAEVGVLLLDGSQTPFLRELRSLDGIRVFTPKTAISIYNPLCIRQIRKVISDYDVVHAHLFPALYWTALARLTILDELKLVATEHNSTNRRRNSGFFRFVDQIIYRQFDTVVTISDAVDSSLKIHLGSNTKLNLFKIHNGIDLTSIRNAQPYPKNHLGLANSDRIILQVSSFTPQKDQQTLIRAMSLLPSEFKLILIGDGPFQSKCRSLVAELGLNERVLFLGVRSDVPRLLKTADQVVLSSFFEGMSLSSIEGMASGRPFIASDVPGLTEVVDSAGMLFELQNHQQLAQIITQLDRDGAHRKQIISACLARAERFDIELMVDRHMDLYRKIVSHNSSTA